MYEHLRESQPSNTNADINKRCGLSVLLLEGKYHEGSLPPNYFSSFSVTSGQCPPVSEENLTKIVLMLN